LNHEAVVCVAGMRDADIDAPEREPGGFANADDDAVMHRIVGRCDALG
jgi:hypothetical protein